MKSCITLLTLTLILFAAAASAQQSPQRATVDTVAATLPSGLPDGPLVLDANGQQVRVASSGSESGTCGKGRTDSCI
jgi:hypothetical protein